MKKITFYLLFLMIIEVIILAGCCSRKNELVQIVNVIYYETKAVAKSYNEKYVIVETFRISALNDSTMRQKPYLMLLSKGDYESIVGKYIHDPKIFSICPTILTIKINSNDNNDTIYSPIISEKNKPHYIVGKLDEYGDEIFSGKRRTHRKGDPTGYIGLQMQILNQKFYAAIRKESLGFANKGCFLIGKNYECGDETVWGTNHFGGGKWLIVEKIEFSE